MGWLKGRLGLSTARIPQADRHGMLWLSRGKLFVEDGCVKFVSAGSDEMEPGLYDIPFQGVSFFLIAPGVTITHDTFRLVTRHGTGLLFVGEDGVRCYAMCAPWGADDSKWARKQVRLWADEAARVEVARRLFALRMGVVPRQRDLNALRGAEASRARKAYETYAQQFGVPWDGRRYDAQNPEDADLINQAINHASSAVRAAAMVAVGVTSTIPQLGFIHESSAQAFTLDIADLYREEIVLHVAFSAFRHHAQRPGTKIERVTRRMVGEHLRVNKTIPEMIDRIQELLDADFGGGDAECP